jgi:hypothetical protein
MFPTEKPLILQGKFNVGWAQPTMPNPNQLSPYDYFEQEAVLP